MYFLGYSTVKDIFVRVSGISTILRKDIESHHYDRRKDGETHQDGQNGNPSGERLVGHELLKTRSLSAIFRTGLRGSGVNLQDQFEYRFAFQSQQRRPPLLVALGGWLIRNCCGWLVDLDLLVALDVDEGLHDSAWPANLDAGRHRAVAQSKVHPGIARGEVSTRGRGSNPL
jgi:hypothetical protein